MDKKYAKDVPQVEPLGFVAKTQGEQSCRLALRLLTWPAGQMEGAPHPETSEEETSGAEFWFLWPIQLQMSQQARLPHGPIWYLGCYWLKI